MVNTELHCVQLFIRYIRLVTTLMLDKLPCAAVYCHAVCCVLRIVEWCPEVFNQSIWMLSITAVLGSHEFGLRRLLGAQWGCQISTGREDFAGGSAVLPMLRVLQCWEIWEYLERIAVMRGGCERNYVMERRRRCKMQRQRRVGGGIIYYDKEAVWGVATPGEVVWLLGKRFCW
jgi:hypothetical protein